MEYRSVWFPNPYNMKTNDAIFFFLSVLLKFHNCFTSEMFWGLLKKIWFLQLAELNPLKGEDYFQLAFLVILIEMICSHPLRKVGNQKLNFRFYWSCQICTWYMFSLCLNGKSRDTRCMTVTVEMPIASGEGSVNLAVNVIPFKIRSKFSYISRSEEKDSSSSRVFVRTGSFKEICLNKMFKCLSQLEAFKNSPRLLTVVCCEGLAWWVFCCVCILIFSKKNGFLHIFGYQSRLL